CRSNHRAPRARSSQPRLLTKIPYAISLSHGTISSMASSSGRSGALVGYGGEGGIARLPVPPTQARGGEKRDRIYRVALRRYIADGVAGTTVGEVIADAGVSWATFFRYFPRKEDVLIELAARHYRDHVRTAAAAGLEDRRLSVRTVAERTFTALLE